MSSLKYEITQIPISPVKIKNKKSTIMTQTVKEYRNDAIHFGEWCKKNRGIRHLDELCAQKVTLLQDYADDLAAQGKSAATIHKYMSGACRVFGVELGSITKPQRSVADVTRSRGRKPVDERADAQREASPRLYDFAERVGIRRAEYAALHGSDFGEDEVGPYVLVRRGKGGKRQKQRLLPSDADFVRAYFDGSEELVFSEAEMRNKIDLHHLRAMQGQRVLQYYTDRCDNEPGYREKLLRDIKCIWDEDDIKRKTNGLRRKHWHEGLYTGRYYLRGRTRTLALQLGLPVTYDRLCVLAVSVFHLSHWRLDVTVDNYLLAQYEEHRLRKRKVCTHHRRKSSNGAGIQTSERKRRRNIKCRHSAFVRGGFHGGNTPGKRRPKDADGIRGVVSV